MIFATAESKNPEESCVTSKIHKYEENEDEGSDEDITDPNAKPLTPEEKKERIKAKKKERKKRKQEEAKILERERKAYLENLKSEERKKISSKKPQETEKKSLEEEQQQKQQQNQNFLLSNKKGEDGPSLKENGVTMEEKPKLFQTNPPKIPISTLFPDGIYPKGEISDYIKDFNCYRTTNEEKRLLERTSEKTYEYARKAAEVHRQVRQNMQSWIKPGMKMIDICEELENRVRLLVGADGLKQGIAFPTGCSLNHCAAHYTPNPGDKTVLQKTDVMKLDFGVHVNGKIIDSAFTMIWDETFQPLLDAARAATNIGVREAGIDVRICDISEVIQEVMESHEVEINKKVYHVKAVRNLCGHNIESYRIHGGKMVPGVKNNDTTKMEENEFFAIETFGTTGSGTVRDDVDCSHYMREFNLGKYQITNPGAKKLLSVINKEFGTLAFCRRYLDRLGEEKHALPLHHLLKAGIINDYPPLVDIKGSYVAQFEHTLVLKPTGKEVLSRGDDY